MNLTHDVFQLDLAFPNPEWFAGMWPGAHFKFHSDINGERVSRMYTPVSPIN